ncbi:MAG: AAA family ATPase [Treponema sp.]|nr:AAA family ATPase [Treponema sp.]
MLGVDFIGADFKLSKKHKMDKLCYYLPYSFLIGRKNEGIVFLKPGALMRCYSFTCPDLGSASAENIAATSSYFNSAIKRFGDGWACHFESRRQLTDKYPGCSWNNMLGYLIDSRRRDNFKNKNSHYVNYFFLTLTYQVKSDLVNKGSGLIYKKDESEGEDYYNKQNISKELQFFRDKSEELLSFIKSRIELTPLNNDEVVSYIASSLSTKWKNRIAPTSPAFFDSFITEEDIETGTCMKIGDMYCPVVAVRDFPSETYPAVFDLLNKADVDYRWTTRWIGMNKDKSSKLIAKYQKRFNNSRKSWGQVIAEASTNVYTDREDPAAIAFEQDTNEAKVALSNDAVNFGYYTSCVEVWDKDYDTALDKARYIAELINSCGFGAKVEKTNSFQAWLGMLPGNNYADVHKTLLSSANCSHVIPLSSLWTGDFYNGWTDVHLGCGAPLLTATSYRSPFFLNLNVGDVFHSFIFGPSGSGKSTFLCLLESLFTRYRDYQVIILDKDKTARGVCIAAGGLYVEPGADDFAFQPLKDLETELELTWACEFIELCLSEQHISCDAEKSEIIRNALIQLRETKSPDKRTITSFQQYVQDDVIKVGIEPYTLDGQYGSIFDARDTNLEDSQFTMIEMGRLMQMGKACITPALMFIFKFIESKFAAENDDMGHPTLLVLDEAWVFLDNPYFEQRIDTWLRTLRKKHVAVVFATQDVPSVAKSSIASTILSQCFTRFYLADPNALSDMLCESYRTFGLSDSEISCIAGARMKNDYFYKSPSGSRLFQLELDDFQLALLAPPKSVLDGLEYRFGRNSKKELAVDILTSQGINPAKYLKEYK